MIGRTLCVERLETRQLLSSITVDGTDSDDALIIIAKDVNSGTYQLNNGPAISFSAVDSFVFNGEDGADRLEINNPAHDVFAPLSGVTYAGDSGADRLVVRGGNVQKIEHRLGQPSTASRTETFYSDKLAVVTTEVETSEDWIAAETRHMAVDWHELPQRFNTVDGKHAITWSDGYEVLFADPTNRLDIDAAELIVKDVSVNAAYASFSTNGVDLNGKITFAGRFDVAGYLRVSGNTTVNGEVHVGGNISFDALSLSQFGEVSGHIAINSLIEVTGNVSSPRPAEKDSRMVAAVITFGSAGALITPGEGTVELVTRERITMEDGAIIDGGNRDVSLIAHPLLPEGRGDMRLAHVITTGSVTAHADGDIIDGGDKHIDIIAASARLTGNVGRGAPLETDVQFLEGDGHFEISNIGDLVLGNVDASASITADNLRITGAVTARRPDPELGLRLVFGDSLQLDWTGRIAIENSEHASIDIRPAAANADHQIQLLGHIKSGRVDIRGGAGNDTFVIGQTNHDERIDVEELNVQGLAGNDTFHLIPSRTTDSRVEGGPGDDVLFVHPSGTTGTVLPERVVFTDGFRDIAYSDAVVEIEDRSLTVYGTNADDVLSIMATDANSGGYQLNSGPIIPFSGIDSFAFDAGGGSDRLEVNNPSGGAFAPTSGLHYLGGAGTDHVAVWGGGVQSVRHAITTEGWPPIQHYEILYDGHLGILATDVESIDDSNAVASRSLEGPAVSRLFSDGGRHALSWADGLVTSFSDPADQLIISDDMSEWSLGSTATVDDVSVGGSLRLEAIGIRIKGRLEVAGDIFLNSRETSLSLTSNGSIIAPGPGSVTLHSDWGIAMADGATLDGGSGNVSLSVEGAAGSLRVGLSHVTTTGMVSIRADGGIWDGGDTHIDVVAPSAYLAGAFGGVNGLETDVRFLTGGSSLGPDFKVTNSGDLVLGDVRAEDSVSIVAGNLRVAGTAWADNLSGTGGVRLVFGDSLQLEPGGRIGAGSLRGSDVSIEILPVNPNVDHDIQLMGTVTIPWQDIEPVGRINIYGGDRHDTMVIGNGIDVAELTVQGLGGDDTFELMPLTNANARVEGGPGNDVLYVDASGVPATVLPDRIVFSDSFRDILYSDTDVSIWLAGDADEDGQVQFSDFVTLANNFGRTDAIWSDGDFDGDGDVDFSDFTLLARNFGRSILPVAALSLSATSQLDELLQSASANSAAETFVDELTLETLL